MRVDLLSLLVTCSLFWTGQCRRPFVFIFKSIECSANPKFVSSLGCSIEKTNSSSPSTISIELVLTEDLTKGSYDVVVSLPQASQAIVLLNNSHLDVCEFLENKSPLRLVQIIRKEFEKYSNMPNKCPFPKKIKLQTQRLKLDPELFPNYVPETKFNSIFRIYQNDESSFNITIRGTCESTRRFFSGRG